MNIDWDKFESNWESKLEEVVRIKHETEKKQLDIKFAREQEKILKQVVIEAEQKEFKEFQKLKRLVDTNPSVKKAYENLMAITKIAS